MQIDHGNLMYLILSPIQGKETQLRQKYARKDPNATWTCLEFKAGKG